MEYGDRPQSSGFLGKVKSSIYKRLDPAAKQERDLEIQESIRTRQSKIKEEQRFRADVRAGRRKGGLREYAGSVINERKQKSAIGGLEEKLDPNLKRYRAFQRREKANKAFAKVERGFDQIADAYDSVGSYFDSGKKGKSSAFGGLDIDELSGLKGGPFGSGSGSSRKSSGGARPKQVPIMRGKKVIGYRQVGGRKKSAPKREAQDWSDLF